MTLSKRPKRSSTPKTIPLDHSHLVVGSTLPATHIKGRISIVWGKNASISQGDIPRVSFSINHKFVIPVGYQPNDYVLPTEKERIERYEIKINIYHSKYNPNSQVDKLKDDVQNLSEEGYDWLIGLSKKQVSIDTTGMEVVKKAKGPDNGDEYIVEIQAIGERELEYDEGRKLKKLMPDIPLPSQAPEWFTSSAPTVSSPVHPTSQHQSLDTSNKGESSRLKPLTSFPPPDLARVPSRSSTSSHSSIPPRPTKQPLTEEEEDRQGDKRVRGIEKCKEAGGIDEHPAVNKGQVKESQVVKDVQKETKKGPRTAVQLGPPGYQALINTVTSPVNSKGKEKRRPLPIEPHEIANPAAAIIDEQDRSETVEQSATDPEFPIILHHFPPQTSPKNNLPNASADTSRSIHTADNPTPAEHIHSTPFKAMTPFRSPSITPFNPAQAISSPSYPSRRQSIPAVSQSSPMAFTPRAERERLVDARRQAEEQRRGEVQAAQAESSRAAQARLADVQRLERALFTNGTEYTPLRHLVSGSIRNITGVVVATKAVTKSFDYLMSVILCDPTRHAGDPSANEELVVSIFRTRQSDLPINVSPGSVMLFRGLKISMFGGKTKAQAFSSSNNTWVYSEHGKEIKYENQSLMNPPLNRMEVDRMVDLFNWYKDLHQFPYGAGTFGSDTPSRRSSLTPGVPRDAITLSQVSPAIFFDAVVKIMYVVRNNLRKPDMELYVSDGTTSTAYQLRNFHNIQIQGLPNEALFILAIHDLPPAHDLPSLDVGSIVKLENVRSKLYKGALELSWSELPTSDQALQGWRRRRCMLVDEDDERARVIERRLRALKRGETVDSPAVNTHQPILVDDSHNISSTTNQIYQPNENVHSTLDNGTTGTDRPSRIATHLQTIHTDPIEHPLSAIGDILNNPTIPNKYRIIAQIKSIVPRCPSDSIIQAYCTHCASSLKNGWTWCQSCNDTDGEHSEWRYRFLVILKDEKGDELAGLVADDEAAEFLPPLPPWSTSTNPNDLRKSERRRVELIGQVYNILQGAKMDGVRTKPYIDMSLEVYHIIKPNAEAENGKKEKVVVARMFGMKSVTQ
ncbi:uncharacterized protein L199_006934 [Kwoniella botswanensis]|uniref:uncharacterized protein n=1 Tax=Kwoniella botswanensis TaxID=1268659 RepID=UPI00315D53D8